MRQENRTVRPAYHGSDGMHYAVEIKRQDPDACWELMEGSWESPTHFDDEGEAEIVARNLVIRHDGNMETRVVGPAGKALITFRLNKYLTICRHGALECREELSPNAMLPMLSEARDSYRMKSVGDRTS